MDIAYHLNPGSPVSGGLGFLAHSIVVDNPTAQWWYVPAAGAYIEPYILGVILQIEGTEHASIQAVSAPAGVAELPAIAGQIGTVVFHSDYLPASEGRPILGMVSGPVSVTPLTVIGTAQTTIAVANTAVQLTGMAGKSVSIRALNANISHVVIGLSGVTNSNGYELAAGQAIDLIISNSNLLYVNGATVGDGVSYIVLG